LIPVSNSNGRSLPYSSMDKVFCQYAESILYCWQNDQSTTASWPSFATIGITISSNIAHHIRVLVSCGYPDPFARCLHQDMIQDNHRMQCQCFQASYRQAPRSSFRIAPICRIIRRSVEISEPILPEEFHPRTVRYKLSAFRKKGFTSATIFFSDEVAALRLRARWISVIFDRFANCLSSNRRNSVRLSIQSASVLAGLFRWGSTALPQW
jgi:hypothetical protein